MPHPLPIGFTASGVHAGIKQKPGKLDQIRAKANPGITPQKLADEKCGDTDCYHVQLALSCQDLAALSSAAASSGTQLNSLTLDLWTRKNDLRPAKFAIGADATGDAAPSGAVNQNLVPPPSSLDAPISPPISSTSCRAMARPSPVPP